MSTGIVKWFDQQKGYGFIEPDDGGNDVFVHISTLEQSGVNSITENDKVSYVGETADKGTKAVSVSLI